MLSGSHNRLVVSVPIEGAQLHYPESRRFVLDLSDLAGIAFTEMFEASLMLALGRYRPLKALPSRRPLSGVKRSLGGVVR